MKKIIVAVISLLFLGVFLFFLLPENVKVIKPFDHPLFVNEEDLVLLGFSEYHFIENKGTLGKEYASIILPKKNSFSPTDAVFIVIYERADASTAKEYFEKLGTIKFDDEGVNYIDDYENLGEHNVLFTTYDEDEYVASLRVLYGKYVVKIQVDSVNNLEQAKGRVVLFTQTILEKIEKL